MAAKAMRRRLTCVAISGGIINVINEVGNIESYAQRGIKKLSLPDQCYCIENGILHPGVFQLQELPSNISIEFEDPCMGKPRASFNKKLLAE